MKTAYSKSLLLMAILSLFTIPIMAREYLVANDPLIELIKNDFTDNGCFGGTLKLFASKKTISGMDTTFLGNYSVKTDKLPDHIVSYLDRELQRNTSDGSILEYNFRNTMAYIRFTETQNLDFLRIGTKTYPGYALRRIDSFSPLYERYLREGIEHKLAQYAAFLSRKRDANFQKKGFEIVLETDLFIHAAIIYKRALASKQKELAEKCLFTAEYLFPIWVFVHSDLFTNHTDSQRWQKFMTMISKKSNSIFDLKFCYGLFIWIGEIFTVEFKDTQYAECLKRIIGDEKEWKSFLICCQYASKGVAEYLVKIKEREAKEKNAIAKAHAQYKAQLKAKRAQTRPPKDAQSPIPAAGRK